MAHVQYHSSTKEKSWKLPVKWLRPHLKLTYGVWFRKTIDKPMLRASSATSDALYDHTPLTARDIRIFSLNPGEGKDPITGSLAITSLDQPCAYDALSYAWGSLGLTSTVQVNKSTFAITENLLDALCYIRSPTEIKVLWIDAICINQNDIRERSQQVQQMKDVFSTASKVYAWLGPSTEHTEVGMRTLESFLNAKILEDAAWRVLPPALVFQGLTDILQRPWFQRFWVVQEGALAKEVVMSCGPHHISWSNQIRPVLSFLRTIKIAVTSPQWQAMGLNNIDMDFLLGLLQSQLESGPDADLWANRSRMPDLLELAYSMRNRNATDLRDRIYALLGIANAENQIIPDYLKSAEDTYDEFARKASRQTKIMCEDLEAAKRSETKHHPSESAEEATMPVQLAQDANDTKALGDFMDQTCARVQKDILENDFDAAARLMEGAAMLLRGHKFHAQP